MTIIASVVVFPEPVAPVTITSPSRTKASRSASGFGKARPLEVRNGCRHHAQAGAELLARLEQVGAKAADGSIHIDMEGKIEILLRMQTIESFPRTKRVEDALRLFRLQRFVGQLRQVAVQAHYRGVSHDEVQVRGAGGDRPAQPVTELVVNGRPVVRWFLHGVPGLNS